MPLCKRNRCEFTCFLLGYGEVPGSHLRANRSRRDQSCTPSPRVAPWMPQSVGSQMAAPQDGDAPPSNGVETRTEQPKTIGVLRVRTSSGIARRR